MARVIKYIMVIAVLGAVVALWYFQGMRSPEQVQRPDPPVTVVTPRQADLKETITLGGHIESETTITVLPRVSGLLDELYVEAGDAVKAGEIIGEIDKEPLRLQYLQAEAAYLAAKSVFERTSRLYESKAATLQDYDQARTQYNTYKAQYDLAKLQMSYTTLRAPMDGVVLVRHTSPGSLVSPQVPIVTVGNHDTLKITSMLPERFYDTFLDHLDSMTVLVSRPVTPNGNPANSMVIEAEITRMSPYVTPETKKFEVVSRVTGGQLSLRPGMYVTVTYVLDERIGVYSLPHGVMTAGSRVWYVDPEVHTAHRITMDVTFATETRFAVPDEYRDTLFIIEGQHFLQEGQRVRILGQRDL